MWLGGHWNFVLQFNICYVFTASVKHNKHDSTNNSDGQETADSHNGNHISRERCSLSPVILASSSFWIYKNNETSWQTEWLNISLWLQKLHFRYHSIRLNLGWKTHGLWLWSNHISLHILWWVSIDRESIPQALNIPSPHSPHWPFLFPEDINKTVIIRKTENRVYLLLKRKF